MPGTRATTDEVVSVRYTLRDGNGELLESTNDEAMEYLHGHEDIVPGLEQELEGKQVGAQIDVTVPSAQAYGERREDGPAASADRAAERCRGRRSRKTSSRSRGCSSRPRPPMVR